MLFLLYSTLTDYIVDNCTEQCDNKCIKVKVVNYSKVINEINVIDENEALISFTEGHHQ